MEFVKQIQYDTKVQIHDENEMKKYLEENHLKVSEEATLLTVTNEKNVCVGFVLKDKD